MPGSCVDVKSNVIMASEFYHLIGQISEREREVFSNYIKCLKTERATVTPACNAEDVCRDERSALEDPLHRST